MRRFFILFSILVLLFGCAPKSDKIQKAKPFPTVSVPSMIGSEGNLRIYVAKNFWNRYFDSVRVFSQDTSFIGGVTKKDFNLAFNQYASIVCNVPLEVATSAQQTLINKALLLKKENPSSNVFEAVVELSELIFYGVNSDFRNEEIYLPIAKALSSSPIIDEIRREKYATDVANCSLNRIGENATDFSYTTSKSVVSSLYKIKADYTLLFFSNPGCTACKEIIQNLKNSLKVQMLEERGILKVLNMYIDEDLTEWFKYMPIYPDNWINAYDPNSIIRSTGIYSVRAIPSLYLLDKEKRVIFKDVPPYVLMNYFEKI